MNTIFVGATTSCNAKCFTCDRHAFSGWTPAELSLEVFEKLLVFEKFVLIGGMGDFICHSKSLEVIRMLKNKKILIDTNGAIHDKKYWTEMGKLMSCTDKVMRFNIDSLTGTDPHRGTDADRAIENLKFFVDAGGNAEVKIIKFKYNENKIYEMIRLFKGIVDNVYLQTSRVYNEDLPKPETVQRGTWESLFTAAKSIKASPKECIWKRNGWMYISEYGELFPCCHIDGCITNFECKVDYIPQFIVDSYIGKDLFGEDFITLYNKCREEINLNFNSIDTAMNSEIMKFIYSNFNTLGKCHIYCNSNGRFTDLINKLEKV